MSVTKQDRIIMGVDPGTNILGYSILIVSGTQYKLEAAGVVHLDKIGDAYEKLKRIHEKISMLINSYQPTEFSIEAPFFGKNVQSMLKLGRAQGVAISVAMTRDVPVYEYSPKKVKLSVTGNGNADKEQVSAMVLKYLKIDEKPTYFDTTDAIAVALCHAFQNSNALLQAGKANTWKKFITENPARVSLKKNK